MQLFGKDLFTKGTTDYLYDFAQHGILRDPNGEGMLYAELNQYVQIGGTTATASATAKKVKVPRKPKEYTPKQLFELRTLHLPGLAINCDKAYLDSEIDTLKGKLELLPVPPKPKKNRRNNGYDQPVAYEGGATMFGRRELASMVERLNNRRQYKGVEKDFAQWPYTTSELIAATLGKHKNLQAKTVNDTLPDLPKDAIDAMKEYTKLTQSLCGKRPIFYLIAEKKQQTDVARRRDPLLLAQSPFGFFWQILGAWDEEIVLLEEL